MLCRRDLVQALAVLQISRQLAGGQLQALGYLVLNSRQVLFQGAEDDPTTEAVAVSGAGLVRLQLILDGGGLALCQLAILDHLSNYIFPGSKFILLQGADGDVQAVRQVL